MILFTKNFKCAIVKENNEIFSRPFSFPLNPKWDNYSTAWEAADVPLHMLNTVIYAVCSVAGVTIASAMTSYVIARIEKGRKMQLPPILLESTP